MYIMYEGGTYGTLAKFFVYKYYKTQCDFTFNLDVGQSVVTVLFR